MKQKLFEFVKKNKKNFIKEIGVLFFFRRRKFVDISLLTHEFNIHLSLSDNKSLILC